LRFAFFNKASLTYQKKKLFGLQGNKFNFSSSYHPQTNGQTEAVNRNLEMYLHCFTGDKPKDWVKWLSWVEYTYNTSCHTSAGKTPFEVVFGRFLTTLSFFPLAIVTNSLAPLVGCNPILSASVEFKKLCVLPVSINVVTW
jgi:hypothetical protein